MIARGFPHVFAMAAAALLLAACSGGGSGPLSPQAGAVPQGSGYVAQSAAAGGVGSLAQAAPPLPTAGLDLGLKVLPNLTAPIINDSGTFPGGAIIVGRGHGRDRRRGHLGQWLRRARSRAKHRRRHLLQRRIRQGDRPQRVRCVRLLG